MCKCAIDVRVVRPEPFQGLPEKSGGLSLDRRVLSPRLRALGKGGLKDKVTTLEKEAPFKSLVDPCIQVFKYLYIHIMICECML